VTVDTTAQPKAITFPTDAKLLHAAIKHTMRLWCPTGACIPRLDGAPTASNWPSKDRVSGSNAPLPALRYQAVTWFDQNGLSAFAQVRRGATGDPPLQQRTRNETRTKYWKDVQDSDAYERLIWIAR
jgi:hypothetical protein